MHKAVNKSLPALWFCDSQKENKSFKKALLVGNPGHWFSVTFCIRKIPKSLKADISHLENRAGGLRFFCLVTCNHRSILCRFYYIMVSRLCNSHVTVIRHLCVLKASNMNHLPTSFYFLAYFFSSQKCCMNSNDIGMCRTKNEKEKQAYDPPLWFSGIYQRKSRSVQKDLLHYSL